jgi:hypothetical protein
MIGNFGLPRSTRHWLTENRSLGWRLAIIGGVLLSSAILPLRLSWEQLILLPGLLVALAGVLVFLYYPPLGILALFVTGLILPSPNLPGGLNLAVLHLGLLVGLWLFRMFIEDKRIHFVASRVVKPLLLLCAIVLLSFVVGQLRWFMGAEAAPIDAQIGGVAIFILAIGALLMTAQQITDLRWLEWMCWSFVALGGFFALGWSVPALGAVTGGVYQVGATANAIFWTWLVAISFSQAVFNQKMPLVGRGALGLICLITIYVAFVLAYDWKSGWLPPFVAIATMLGIRFWQLALAVAPFSVAPILALGSQAIATDEYSYSTRVDAWKLVLEMSKVNPLLGFGPANYYWYTPLFPIRGYAVQFNSHNQYVDIIAQIGLLGLSCFIWFIAEVGWLGWQLRTKAPEGFQRAYVYGALGGLAGTVVAGGLVDWIFPFVYNIGFNGFRSSVFFWLFLGGLVSIEQKLRVEAYT